MTTLRIGYALSVLWTAPRLLGARGPTIAFGRPTTFLLSRRKCKRQRETRAATRRIARSATIFALAAWLISGTVPATAQVGAVAGAGSRSCEQVQADIADLPNLRRAYVSWMQGYLSGRNAAREAEALALVDLDDYEAQWAWLSSWCAERPSSSFAQAVDALFDERVRVIASE
jgi:hypothetical protein